MLKLSCSGCTEGVCDTNKPWARAVVFIKTAASILGWLVFEGFIFFIDFGTNISKSYNKDEQAVT